MLISFAAYKRSVPQKFHPHLQRLKRTRGEIDYHLTRFGKHLYEVVHPTDVFPTWRRELTPFLLSLPRRNDQYLFKSSSPKSPYDLICLSWTPPQKLAVPLYFASDISSSCDDPSLLKCSGCPQTLTRWVWKLRRLCIIFPTSRVSLNVTPSTAKTAVFLYSLSLVARS